MTTVYRPRCTACHHAALLAAEDITLTIAEHGARFAFTCRNCGACSGDRVAPQIVDFLVAHGVQAHLLMPQETGPAGPLSEDDLIDIGRELAALPTTSTAADASVGPSASSGTTSAIERLTAAFRRTTP